MNENNLVELFEHEQRFEKPEALDLFLENFIALEKSQNMYFLMSFLKREVMFTSTQRKINVRRNWH